jgi:hypothetical protein
MQLDDNTIPRTSSAAVLRQYADEYYGQAAFLAIQMQDDAMPYWQQVETAARIKQYRSNARACERSIH